MEKSVESVHNFLYNRRVSRRERSKHGLETVLFRSEQPELCSDSGICSGLILLDNQDQDGTMEAVRIRGKYQCWKF